MVTGDDTGRNDFCTVVGLQAFGTVQETLSKGTITTQGSIDLQGKNKNAPFAVTGGIGAYDGARGTALVTDTSSNTTDIQITFRP